MISMFASALLTGGIGPWLGYQVFAAAWIGLLAGSLPKKVRGHKEILLLISFSILASGFFGVLMDLQFWPWALGSNTQLSYLPNGDITENISRFITFHCATAMAWDIPRAIFTSILIAFTGGAVLSALRRTHTRAAFMTPILFSERVK
jgi:energy-coupling factor transport system substrate-specific component